jgi:hypothetical protein
MHVSNASRTFCGAALMAIVGAMPGLTDSDTFYDQTNLVSDIRHQGRFEPNFVNAWGLDAGPTSPWWVNTNGTGLSFILDGAGTQIRPPVLATAIGAPRVLHHRHRGGHHLRLESKRQLIRYQRD